MGGAVCKEEVKDEKRRSLGMEDSLVSADRIRRFTVKQFGYNVLSLARRGLKVVISWSSPPSPNIQSTTFYLCLNFLNIGDLPKPNHVYVTKCHKCLLPESSQNDVNPVHHDWTQRARAFHMTPRAHVKLVGRTRKDILTGFAHLNMSKTFGDELMMLSIKKNPSKVQFKPSTVHSIQPACSVLRSEGRIIVIDCCYVATVCS